MRATVHVDVLHAQQPGSVGLCRGQDPDVAGGTGVLVGIAPAADLERHLSPSAYDRGRVAGAWHRRAGIHRHRLTGAT